MRFASSQLDAARVHEEDVLDDVICLHDDGVLEEVHAVNCAPDEAE